MNIGELLDFLKQMPRDEEVFVIDNGQIMEIIEVEPTRNGILIVVN